MKVNLVSACISSIQLVVVGFAFYASPLSAQQPLTWDEVKAKFEAVNPTLKADEINVEEM